MSTKKENSEDKFDIRFNEINEPSNFYADIEGDLPNPFENSTEDNEKNVSENKDKYKMDYSIPDEPFKNLHKTNEHNVSSITSDEQMSVSERNNDKKNIAIPNELKIDHKKENSSEKMEEEEFENTFLSKKTKDKNENKNNSNKFKDTNVRRKCKLILLGAILNFTNDKLEKFYNNNIGKGIFIKKLQSLNQKQTSGSNVKFNQDLLNKTIKDIFSDDICRKINNLPPDHNRKLIEHLLNEKNIIIKDFFTNLFNLTFLQCLEHFRGTKFYNELNGMKKFEEDSSSIGDDKEYLKILDYYIQNYETIINNKKPRKSKNKEEN